MVRRWLLTIGIGMGFLVACTQPGPTASPALSTEVSPPPAAIQPVAPTATPSQLLTPDPLPALVSAPAGGPLLAAAVPAASALELDSSWAAALSDDPLDALNAEQSASVPAASFQICSPLEGIPLDELRLVTSAPYAPPPGLHSDQRHQGIDFSFYQKYDHATIEGVPVQTVLPGQVAAAIAGSFPFGNLLIVETPPNLLPGWLQEKLSLAQGQSLYVLFAHLKDAVPLHVGDVVTGCQVVGAVGKSGNAGQCHLHLETRLGPSGATFEVMGYYTLEATPAERESYLRWRTSGEFCHFNPQDLLLAEAPAITSSTTSSDPINLP